MILGHKCNDVDTPSMSFVLIILGLVFIGACVNGLRESREHFKRGQKTEAVIVALEETTTQSTESGKWSKAYYAVYAYRDNDGNEHRMRGSRVSTTKGTFTIGAPKTVFFNPDRPMEVQDSPAKVFSGLTVGLIAGVGMVAFGIAALVLDWDL